MHNYPKLHNAMWPGLVGKGARRRAAHRSRHDARSHRRRGGGRREVRRRRPLPLRPARQTSTRRDDDLKRLADKIASRNLVVGSVVAPVWPPTGGGSAMGSDDGAQELRRPRCTRRAASPRSSANSASGQYGVVRIDSAGGPSDWAQGSRGQPEEDRRDVPRGVRRRRRTTASGSPPRARSAGAACTAGSAMVELLELVEPPEDARLPGRHGAHAALHARLQRPRGPHPARGLRLEDAAKSSTRR